MSQIQLRPQTQAAIEYTQQSKKLSLEAADPSQVQDGGRATEAKFITPLDAVIETADGSRLPAVPVVEAHKFNVLKAQAEGRPPPKLPAAEAPDQTDAQVNPDKSTVSRSLTASLPPSTTHPLFPPLPLYGPPSLLRHVQSLFFRLTSFYLSTAFLAVIVLGSAFTSLPLMFNHIFLRLTFRNPDARRPFHQMETERRAARRDAERRWSEHQRRRRSKGAAGKEEEEGRESPTLPSDLESYEPTEGGPDPLVCDVAYYARRVGLDAEEFQVQTEDGFVIGLWHVYHPGEYRPAPAAYREHDGPEELPSSEKEKDDEAGTRSRSTGRGYVASQYGEGRRRYPVLLMHGLLQSAGAYCSNDEDSLAFYLCKAGYDVWLGNNRCGFRPRHALLRPRDPRMWAWNIRHMGVLDLAALLGRVLAETGFARVGLVCHSQGTTEAFVALAKSQRPELGDRVSVFCALAPAVYAGPLIGKMYFKFMRVISPAMFRLVFGIHAFIPLMMTMHAWLPGRLYGAMGYRVFSFLFGWTDDRWDRQLRDRQFQFSPVYVSSESMRWWLGRDCFARHKCILATREEGRCEDVEDETDELRREREEDDTDGHPSPTTAETARERRGRKAWFDDRMPPLALWICGSDELVDGRRLLRRLERGREPFVRVVHAKVIEEYEHLDVIWAIDSIEKVGTEVRQVLWKTVSDDDRRACRLPKGCEAW